ncbi:hypothetical protein SAMN05444955_107123 [Lihuaxuella thermophila]|uniref:Uncharacterized protein n=1 Tax=Lihuaxuella thermophila TaxID=1173111 RepID=A0A1H8EQJ0_9BACL|nr:hypothetical protein SAMN05444955_107123 [Lihuaxuella thermophila]
MRNDSHLGYEPQRLEIDKFHGSCDVSTLTLQESFLDLGEYEIEKGIR